MTPDMLQYGAMGLLAVVLVGGGKILVGAANSLVTSINGLRDEVASFRRQQSHTAHLLTLLLAREFGEKKALELLRESPDELQLRSEAGRNQK